ncbi:alpha/beta fold hydrolase [Afifella pfennigii]|uniref:alpha/beta fold hydrolase n=1 Tax=Afifella pfennigii TaxID=209897 RepID=UPI00047ABD6F|nr:alpha/beta hydrolase [Afifella pfennigii]
MTAAFRICSALAVAFVIAVAACSTTGSELHIANTCAAGARVHDEYRINVDGARLYLLVRGPTCDAPLLLWLHGGPGAAERPLFRLYNSGLEDDFLVAYLDQRGAGRSWDPDADPETLTIHRHLADVEQVVAALNGTYPGRPVLLVGHSWGAALGILFSATYPSDIAAVIAVNPLIDLQASQAAQSVFVAEQARRHGHTSILTQVQEIGAPPFSGSEALALQALVGSYGGEFHNRPSFLGATLNGLFRGFESPAGIVRIIRANQASLDAMADDLAELNLRQSVQRLNVPLVLMLGRYDHILPPSLAEAFAAEIEVPSGRIIWFEDSAHNIPFEQPDAFVDAVARFARELGIAGQISEGSR